MISWMQRHNKYLVATIWVATVAFIGAGAVGWGNISLDQRTRAVAKVGDVEISKLKFSYYYNSIYTAEAQKRGNVFDKELAKRLGLDKIVLKKLINDAIFLNLANKYGIIVTDKEVAKELTTIKSFQDKNGVFNKTYYQNFLKTLGMKAREFESILKDELKIYKLMKLLSVKPLKFERDVLTSIATIEDKIKYDIIKSDDVNLTINDEKLKEYWSSNSINYLTPQRYQLELLWTEAKDLNFSDEEIEKFYKENSFEYVDKNGTIKPLEEVKSEIVKALTLKKLRKEALLARSKFKKGKIEATEVITVDENDKRFPQEIWGQIKNAKVDEVLKPKVVGNKYVTVKIKSIIPPQKMSFEEAKELVKRDFEKEERVKKLEEMAQALLKNSDKLKFETKDYISIRDFKSLDGLNSKESRFFMANLFRSKDRVGTVNLGDKIVVFKIVDQRLSDKKMFFQNRDLELTKSGELNRNLLSNLSKVYKIESYIKGF